MDLGVRLCYLLYAHTVGPEAIINISYELKGASPLFYYLHNEGLDIDEIISNISENSRCDSSQ